MATGQTSPAVSDWQTVDPGDWQTLPQPQSAPQPSVFNPQPPQNVPGLPPGMGAPAPPPNPIKPVGPAIPDLQESRENAGLMQMGQGAKDIWNAPDWNSRAQGASEILRGGMDAGLGAAAALAPMSPVGTVAGVAAGTGAGWATKQAADALGVPAGYSNLAQDVTGLAAGGATAAKLGVHAAPMQEAPSVNPVAAALRAWNLSRDPNILDGMRSGEIKLQSGLSDLKPAFQGAYQPSDVPFDPNGYANEAVLEALPQAKKPLLQAWDTWKQQRAGQTLSARNAVMQATYDALKDKISDPRAQQILEEAERVYGQPASADQFDSWITELNNEAKRIEQAAPARQTAQELAGADTLKTPALLRAQARALRSVYYPWLDPDNGGAGPADVRARLGALLSIEDAASNPATRHAIYSNAHPMNAWERGVNLKLDPRAMGRETMSNPEWQIRSAILSSPDPEQIPLPGQRWTSPQMRLGPGTAPFTQGVSVPDFTGQMQQAGRAAANAPRMLSPGSAPFTQGTTVINPRAMPAQPRLLPPGSPMQGEGVIAVPPPGAADWQIPASPRTAAAPADTSFVRGVPAKAATGESIATRLGKQIWSALGGPEIQ